MPLNLNQIETFSKNIRAHALRMVHRSKSSHIGSCFSLADILATLYGSDLLSLFPSQPEHPDRDRIIVSKGHAAAIVYASLAERGFIPTDLLSTYGKDGSVLGGHVTKHSVPGVELSTGSLGHGLPVACGMALAGMREQQNFRVFCLLSDGEMDEGSNWEALMFAGHHQLENLYAIIDYNKIQSFGTVKDVLDLEPFVDKLKAFRWKVARVDGHDISKIYSTLNTAFNEKGPFVLLADTVKGKGASFMENKLEWHYKSPSDAQLSSALKELGFDS